MSAKQYAFSVDLGKELLEIVDQRAKQEGVNRSEYIREAILLELVLSGDLDGTKFVAKKVGQRIKNALLDRFAGVDLQERTSILSG